ncbi:MAG: fumarate hydratase [Thermodesulfobacteriota bacterium]|nr:fumarate hydratase [Thermodesulfobacteriota bacterium]
MHKTRLLTSMITLIQRAATDLPQDVTNTIHTALLAEDPNSTSYHTLNLIKENITIARKDKLPICQDTGMIMAIIKSRPEPDLLYIEDIIKEAIKALTTKGILRQNCVDTLSGKNTGDNIGINVPQILFSPWDGPIQVYLMLKGGGSENVSTQYSLPNISLKAGRSLDGVRRCLLDAVFRAQGDGCAPGILGVCVGGDRTSGYLHAKQQLFRRLDDTNPIEELGTLEKTVLDQANTLGIGPMGLGGKTTLLGVKIGMSHRHPACYLVSVSYSCWATRRYAIEINKKGDIKKWL